MTETNIQTVDEIPGQEELFHVVQPTLTVGEILQDVLETIQGDLTLYQVSKVLNTVLEILEIEKDGKPYQVRSQMIYNYNRNKMIVKGEVRDPGDRITKEECVTFVTRFVGKLTK